MLYIFGSGFDFTSQPTGAFTQALGVSHELVGGKTKQGNGGKLVRFELKLLQLDMTAVKSNVIVLLFQQWDAHCGHDHIMTGREIGERSRRWR